MSLVAHAQQAWPGTAASVGEARRFVRQTLVGWGAETFEWPAAALVSELATNAVLHAGTRFSVVLTLDDNRLRLAVTDGSPAQPVVRNYGEESTTGRGLRLVVQLSEQWGCDPEKGSKTVWCELSVSTSGRSPEPEVDLDVDVLLAEFQEPDSNEPGSTGSPAREGATDRRAA
jgi:anti-sigma regulatory factor (Ser/Thr protein kinase)